MATGIHFYTLPLLGRMRLVHGVNVTHAFPRHIHTSVSFGIIEDGERMFDIRGESIRISAGMGFIINAHEPHACHSFPPQSHTYWVLCVPSEMLQAIAADLAQHPCDCPHFPYAQICDPALFTLLKALGDAVEHADDLFEQESRCVELLTYCLSFYAQSPDQGPPPSPIKASIEAVREYLAQHYAQPIRLAELARLTHASPFYLNRRFQQEVGLPPYEYLVQLRVKHAQEFLQQGTSIAETAYLTGFSDQSHLTRLFKRHVGITPGEFFRS